MNKHLLLPTALIISASLAACSTTPNDNLEQARQNFDSLQSEPKALKLAALETQDASQTLDSAENAFRMGEDKETVDQLAYLANQKVELAKQTVALRTAERKLNNMAALRAQAQLEARDAQIRKLQESLDAKPTERGATITFGDLLFDLNKADIRPGAYSKIRKLAEFLKENTDRKVLVEGFTDSAGSDAYNLDLSRRRAEGIQRALARQGVDISRISTQGYGEAFPLNDNSTPAARAMNRRVEVTVSHDDNPVAPRR
jgi:outer membrane protein OmpA-like peptidoglycan-associated protein